MIYKQKIIETRTTCSDKRNRILLVGHVDFQVRQRGLIADVKAKKRIEVHDEALDWYLQL
jgi:hypothetical protein